MKVGVEHRVPLSDAALDVLAQVRGKYPPNPRLIIFPSLTAKNFILTPAAFGRSLDASGYGDRTTIHGFRTSFKTWTMEMTDTPWAVGEAALGHTIGNNVAQAYARTDLFDRRRELMQQWGSYVTA